ncbi:MAG: ABC transporter ATP-binding protein [Ferrovibrio sp.]|uniref:ABC transporter ATP-binding protein n=1 Tax=Ferrovibrio sp. TaxID=1917215 RepID=UPI00391AFDF5
MSRIVVEDVTKCWGPARAVDSVSFTAEAGQLLVLLGPSGCGKSTTLRLIAGLETVDAGRIVIGGQEVTHLPPAARRLAMVFQSYALFPHLSVAENIVFGLKVRGIARAERDARLQRVAGLVGLDRLLERRPAELSGGQRQRVALGRAIIAEAPVCLMDEPLSNLDAQLRHEMRSEIRELQQRLGITMIYVTHDQTEAMTMADQVILMRDGRIAEAGTPDNLYLNPQTAFAARFLGTPPMNLLPLDALLPTLPAALRPPGLPVEACLLGIRPERIMLATPGDPAVPAQVMAVEYLGADTVLLCRINGHDLAARIPGHTDLRAGATVRLRWLPGDQHLFGAADGRRIAARSGLAEIPHPHSKETVA